MGSKNGQLFLVGIVFLLGMIFVVQQMLFQYSDIEMSEPFHETGARIENVLDSVKATITGTLDCNETKDSFANRIEELRYSLFSEYGGFYSTEISYYLNCTNWNNLYPQPAPLTMTISVTGRGKDTRGTFDLYHLE